MPFMAINAITIPIDQATFQEKFREIGVVSPAFSGTSNKSTWAAPKSDFTFETIPMVDADAYPWVQLLRGAGERWNFDVVNNLGASVGTMYGSKGTAPTTTSGLTVSAGGVNGNKLVIAAGSSFIVPSTPKWTVSLWYDPNGFGYFQNVITSAGHKWQFAVRNDALSTTWLVDTGTTLRVDATGTPTSIDDYVLLPFEVPDTWGPSFDNLWLTYGGLYYPATPQLVVTGDVVGANAARYYLGAVTNIKAIRTGGGVIRRKLTVTLTEV